jgi:hypothetical protein
VALNIFASVRSLLLALPFIVLYLIRNLERNGSRRTTVAASWIGVGLTAGLGLVLASADHQFAEASRDLAVQASAYRPSAGGQAWFTGEWGLRNYLEKQGYTSITRGDVPAEGDILLIPDVSCPAELRPELTARLTPLGSIAGRPGFRLTTMSFRDRAGFYSNFWGPLPYAPASGPLERAHMFRVRVGRQAGAMTSP